MRTAALLGFVALATPFATAQTAKCSSAYQQCGGDPWSGPTCCPDGFTCEAKDEFYSQCIPNDKTTAPPPTTAPPSTLTPPEPTTAGPKIFTSYVDAQVPYHEQAEYPNTTQYPQKGHRACPSYCSDDLLSEGCSSACKNGCSSPPAEVCGSGTMWGEQYTVGDNEKWHYSRSTHFGLTSGGACGFGYYGLCTKGSVTANWTDPMLNGICDAFCKAYPILCQDPKGKTLRGNFAAPNGDYYTQFWPHLDGEPRDNYLSCGECFEQVRTKPDGTDYKPGEEGYTEPVILEILDSCPCSANSKWCCGSGYDHCAEINFTYGCPIPKDSHHMDLSDIAMGRLAGNGDQPGLIPIRYRRTPCPKPGNIYIWLRDEGGPYYFALSVVNTAGVGSITKVEIKGAKMKDWVRMVRDPNYTAGRPQERYGSWVIPQGAGPFTFPIAMRITSPNGEQVTNMEAIKTFTPPATAVKGFNYIDFGTQFTLYGKQ